MSVPGQFSLTWRYAGHQGRIDSVDVRWNERGVALVGRDIDSVRSVSLSVVFPFDVAAAAAKHGLSTGDGTVSIGGRVLIAGRMRIAHDAPRPEGTPVEIVISDADQQESGTWPPRRDFPIARSDDDRFYEYRYLYPKYDANGNLVRAEDDETWWTRVTPDGTGPPPGVLGTASGPPGYTGGLVWEAVPTLTRANAAAFQGIPQPSDGQTAPYVFGAPGTDESPGSPAWLFDEGRTAETPAVYPKLLIAGHRVQASTVRIHYPDHTEPDLLLTAVCTVQHSTINGSEYAWVYACNDEDTAGPPAITGLPHVWNPPYSENAQRKHYASWTEGQAKPGGAGDVALEVIGQSTLQFDVREWKRVADVLNRYQLAGYCQSPTPAWEWFRSAIVPMLPIAVTGGPFGLRPVLAPWVDYQDPPGIAARNGEGLARADLVRQRLGERYSGVAIDYAPRADTDAFTLRASILASRTPYRVVVQGGGGTDEVSTSFVWDRGTAERMASDMLRVRTLSPRYVRYDVTDRDLYGPGGDRELYAGRIVRLTDDDLGWASVRAVVSEIEIDPNGMIVTFDLRDDQIQGD